MPLVDEGDGTLQGRRVRHLYLDQPSRLQLTLDGDQGDQGYPQPLLHHALGGLQGVQLHGYVRGDPRLAEESVREAEVRRAAVEQDDGLAGDLLHRSGALGSEGVLPVDDEHYLVVVQVDGLYVRMRQGADQPDLDLVGLKHGQHLFGAACVDRDIDAAVAAAKSAQDVGESVGGDRESGAQVEGPDLDVAHLVDDVPPFSHRLQDALRVGEEGEAGVREPHAAAAAFEQLLAQLTLQGLDASGDGRLGQLENFGRAAEAVVGGHLDEGFYLTEVH